MFLQKCLLEPRGPVLGSEKKGFNVGRLRRYIDLMLVAKSRIIWKSLVTIGNLSAGSCCALVSLPQVDHVSAKGCSSSGGKWT